MEDSFLLLLGAFREGIPVLKIMEFLNGLRCHELAEIAVFEEEGIGIDFGGIFMFEVLFDFVEGLDLMLFVFFGG